MMRKILLILLLIYSVISCIQSQSKTYYVSPEGSDENLGLSVHSPWKSIDKVNETTFLPGDAILFESSGVWYGNLQPKGSGEIGNPISLSSYGRGSRPVINIGDEEGYGIYLENQSWWEIEGIEITSGAPHRLGIRRGGIMAFVKGDAAHIEHIYIKDCYVHDIWGQVGGNKSGIAIYVGQRVLGGIAPQNCTASDVLIEDNTIVRVDKVGIAVNGDDNVVIRGNYMENLGGDGIVVIGARRALIERNIADRTCLRSGDPDLDTGGEDWWPHTAAIWLWKNEESVMQYNEVYNTGRQPANGDGFAYDFDFDCRRCILQYNYSANNHGLLLIMNRTFNNVARYNISQNDQTHLIQIQGNTEDGNLIHNNVFYVDHSTVDIDYFTGNNKEKDKTKLGATFKNNIFYAGGQGRFRTAYSHGFSTERKFNDSLRIDRSIGGPIFENNCFFGPWLKGLPEDDGKVVADPLFLQPGSGGIGLSSLAGYQLQADSPCMDRGKYIEMDTKKDFFGNRIKGDAVDLGVHEHSIKSN